METAKQISIPIIADSVLSPDFLYNNHHTGIYFLTSDDKHGRITFENLDAVKICRGEIMPYNFDYSQGTWVYHIQNSRWQQERFDYENKHYGTAYEFGGDVTEMLTDFKHYLFSFHDQFIEVIARGFWYEKSNSSLFKKDLTPGHPFLPLPTSNMEIHTAHCLNMQIRKNTKPVQQLARDAQYCRQKLYEFAIEIEGKARVTNTLQLSSRSGKLISTLQGYHGRKSIEYEGIVYLEKVMPTINTYMKEVYERRRRSGQA